MPDDEQEVNCVVGACCGGADDHLKRRKALTSWLEKHGSLMHADAKVAAEALLDGFDFAPKGTLSKFISRVSELARGNPYT